MTCRPSFNDLTAAQQARFGNGVGPHWLSAGVRRTVTTTASWFFKEASWRHHDFGYVVGGDRWDRARCDWNFLIAMLRDAVTQEPEPDEPPAVAAFFKVPVAVALSLVFYLAVRIGGQFGSFEYRNCPATIEEVLEAYR